jgi:hypothetical protein
MTFIDAYVFRDAAFAKSGEAVVCAIEKREADILLGAEWTSRLFGGCAIYTNPDGTDFVGIWGNRNASRLRRFLRECGAELILHHSRPNGARRRYYSTRKGSRPHVRELPGAAV